MSHEWDANDFNKENKVQAWYVKYRPATLEEYAGEKVVKDVRSRMQPKNRASRPKTWLIYGTHGCGKTTIARILTKYYCCMNPKPNGDPCEECEFCKEINECLISEGDSSSLGNIREVNAAREGAKNRLTEIFDEAKGYAYGSYSILIIDEMQAASPAAQEALLKNLEDMPEDLVVMLATTDADAIKETIQSRMGAKLEIRRHPAEEVADRLETICKAEGVDYDRRALERIAKRSRGIFRDSISRVQDMYILDTKRKIDVDVVDEYFNVVDNKTYLSFLRAAKNGNVSILILQEQELIGAGHEAKDFLIGLSDFIIEGLESTYGKMTAGKDIREFMKNELSDSQALRLINTIGECREHLINASKYDPGYLLVEIAVRIYTNVFAPDEERAERRLPNEQKAADAQLSSGEEKFSQVLQSIGRGTITEDSPEDEDTF